jgi:hypothetical protein
LRLGGDEVDYKNETEYQNQDSSLHGLTPIKSLQLTRDKVDSQTADNLELRLKSVWSGREKTMDKDDLWIVDHFSELVTKYAGKYVAVVNETLVAVGDSGKEVESKAREIEPNKMPSVLRVPREEDMACLL